LVNKGNEGQKKTSATLFDTWAKAPFVDTREASVEFDARANVPYAIVPAHYDAELEK